MSFETTTNTIIVTLMDNTHIPFNIEVIKESLTIKNIMEDTRSTFIKSLDISKFKKGQ